MPDDDAEALHASLAARPDVVSRGEELLGRLLDASHQLHPDDLASVVAAHAEAYGWSEVTVHLVDYHQRLLVPLPVEGMEQEVLDINATLAGRAFRSQQPVMAATAGEDARLRIWVPMVDGVERLGGGGAPRDEAHAKVQQGLGPGATTAAPQGA